MAPTVSSEHMANIAARATDDCSDLLLAISAFLQRPDFANLFFCQRRGRMTFAAMLATLARLVFHVTGLGIKPKMIGVYATRIIAFVANLQVGRRFFAMMKEPSEAIGAKGSALIGQFAISIFVDKARPFPALIGSARDKSGTERISQGLMFAPSLCGLNWLVMPKHEAAGLTLDNIVPAICSGVGFGYLPTSTFAEFWGNIGEHGNSSFLCLIRGRSRGVARYFRVFCLFIIAHLSDVLAYSRLTVEAGNISEASAKYKAAYQSLGG